MSSRLLPLSDLKTLSEFAQELTLIAEQSISKYFRTSLKIDSKTDHTPVTLADREAESLMRKRIHAQFPEHNIIGEEYGKKTAVSDYTWVLDPIDGTRSFIAGIPLFGTLVALLYKGEPVLGVIHAPVLQERWVGLQGEEATFNQQVCHCSQTSKLNEAILCCTDPDMFDAQKLKQFMAVEKEVHTRRFGGDCYSYGMLASGYVDLVVEADMKTYDFMALIPVIEGAGGVITDWEGKALHQSLTGTVLAAATSELHQEALRLLNAERITAGTARKIE